MKVRVLYIAILFFLAVTLGVNFSAGAQVPATGTLRGQVTDPSGLTVSGAAVLLTAPNGSSVDAVTNKDGFYEVTGLAPGTYSVKVVAEGFGLFTAPNIAVKPGQVQTLKIVLSLEEQKLEIHVEDSPTQLDVNPENNAGAIILKDKDLEALSDDPDELQEELQALAGPSAGPNGGQIYIDGFTGGQLPPKASIREIRINQNRLPAEYDKLGYGRIEIFTKPGTDKYHGTINYGFGKDFWNSRNPYSAQKAPFMLNEFEGNVGGPLGKRASFAFEWQRNMVDNGSITNVVTLDPQTLTAGAFTSVLKTPQRFTRLNPRMDYQLNQNNTLTIADD